jgi:hypothetical protein
MPLFGSRSLRQREVRRSLAELMPAWYHRLLEPISPRPLLIVAISAVLAAGISIVGDDPLGVQPGQRVPRAIASRVPILIEDEARTQLMRMRAADTAADYFTLDVSLLQEIRGRLSSALRVAREQSGDATRLIEAAGAIGVTLDEGAARELARLASANSPSGYERSVDRAIEILRRQPLVEPEDPAAPRGTALTSVLVDPDATEQREVSIHRLLFSNVRDDVNRVVELAIEPFSSALRASMRASLVAMLRGADDEHYKPLYRYDAAASTRAAEQASANVETQYIEIGEGSRLADVGEVSPAEHRLLEEEHRRYFATLESSAAGRQSQWLQNASRAAMVFLLVLGVGTVIIVRREISLGAAHQQIATVATLLLGLVAGRTIALYSDLPYLGVGVQAFVVFLLAITSGRISTIATSALFALVLTFTMRQGVAFLVILAAVSLVPFIALQNVRHRGRIIAFGALAAATGLAATMVVGVSEGQTLEFVLWDRAIWAALTTLVAAFVVEGVLPAIERFFGVTTNMTLLEWCDPNKPLLRMMQQEAPGTYNHSLMVGTLASAACDVIGANGLLARAGAYYHDIGKISKPEYFVENQDVTTGNRHDRLTPAMSHLVITGHVKNGLAMAREYRLPPPLHAFIPEHHGTCVVEYFFHAANRARKPDEPEISDDQFRYPGPKPQSRETAVVMLCDSVEGAIRAMPEPTPVRIEDAVAKIVNKRLADGQLDECDLTFRELAEIRASLVRSLCSIYHGRIRYPSDEKETDENEPAESSDEGGEGDQATRAS